MLEYASAQMARALLRAREAQSEVQSQLLEAMHIEPEGKVRVGMRCERKALLLESTALVRHGVGSETTVSSTFVCRAT